MTTEPLARKPLRLWPGVTAAAVLLSAGYLLPAVLPSLAVVGLLAAVGGALLILVWWLAFSRARWYERVGAVILIVAAAMAQRYVVDPSIAGGAMGNLS